MYFKYTIYFLKKLLELISCAKWIRVFVEVPAGAWFIMVSSRVALTWRSLYPAIRKMTLEHTIWMSPSLQKKSDIQSINPLLGKNSPNPRNFMTHWKCEKSFLLCEQFDNFRMVFLKFTRKRLWAGRLKSLDVCDPLWGQKAHIYLCICMSVPDSLFKSLIKSLIQYTLPKKYFVGIYT